MRARRGEPAIQLQSRAGHRLVYPGRKAKVWVCIEGMLCAIEAGRGPRTGQGIVQGAAMRACPAAVPNRRTQEDGAGEVQGGGLQGTVFTA